MILCNIEAERSALGYLISDPKRAYPIFTLMRVNKDWFTDTRSSIWGLIEDLVAMGESVTVPTLSQHLGFRAEEVLACASNAGNASTIAQELQYIGECYGYRWLQRTLRDHADSIKPTTPFDDALGSIRNALNGFSLRPADAKTPESMKRELMEQFHNAKEHGVWGIPSRFINVNNIIAGYQDKKMVLIAARPGEGKTSAGLNEALDKAENVGPVDIYSYEMEAEELWLKMAADRSKVDLMRFKKGDFTEVDEAQLWRAWDEIHKLPISIYSTTMKGEALAAAIRNNHARNGTKFVLVDYIQRISARKKFDGRQAEVGYISNLICDAAKDTCLIMALAQLNRMATRERPTMSHLRESGCLEADAYLIALLYTLPTYKGSLDADDIPTVFEVCKNRGGKIGCANFVFKKGEQHFAVSI